MQYFNALLKLTRTLAISCLVSLIWLSFAQAAPVVVQPGSTFVSLGDQLSYFEDADNRLSLPDMLLEGNARQFTPSRQTYLRFGYTSSGYWLRLDLRNASDQNLPFILEIDRPSLGRVVLYQPQEGQYVATEAGVNTASPSGAMPHRTPVFTLSLPAHSSQRYFIKLESSQRMDLSVSLYDPTSFGFKQNIRQLMHGLACGLLMGICLYSALVSLFTKEKGFLHYAIYLFVITLWVSSNLGYLGVRWFTYPGLQNIFEQEFGVLGLAANTLFARHFLNIQNISHKLDNVLFGVFLITVLMLTLIFFPHTAQVALWVFSVSSTVLIFTALRVWIAGYTPTLFYLLARIPLTIAALMNGLGIFADLIYPITLDAVMLSALVFDGIIISLGLGDRFRNWQLNSLSQRQRVAVAEAEIRTRREVLGLLSHEVRTPMNGILGMTELMMDTPLSHEQRDYLSIVHSSGTQLLQILDDIFDYSKIEAGKMEIHITAFDLSSVITESMDQFKGRAEEKNLELIPHMHANLPTQVKGDPTRIRQVLTHLIENAVKFTDHGEVVIHVYNATNPPNIRFEITDTGRGLTREQLKEIFADVEPTLRWHGKGLGLAIVKQLIRLMGGEFNAESEIGKGSTFWFSLPLERIPEEDTYTRVVDSKLRGLRILIVDDNASVRLALQQQAASWGMQVTNANSAAQALALLHTQSHLNEPFDIVVLDQNMPGMSGLELAAKVKEDEQIMHETLVIMLSGMSTAPPPTLARNTGIRRVLTKPVSGKLLKIALTEELGYLQKTRAETQTSDAPLRKNIRVLVAEDHPLSQKVMRGMLMKLGIEATAVSNGDQALRAVQRNRFDIVLMDVEMPIMNGFEATEKIRAWERENGMREVPIIAMTAHIMDEHKERGLRAGMNAHLTKPIELAQLQDILQRWTGMAEH